jgi:hypothetical protein
MLSSSSGMTAWEGQGSARHCSDGGGNRAGTPFGEPALWFFVRRK